MTFIPAGEFIGQAHRVRTVTLVDSQELPDGEYSFIDMYCDEPDCDCRKTMIQVQHNGKPVAIINFGWESADYYRQWMGTSDDGVFPPMDGASIDLTSPNLLNPDAILVLFQRLLNDFWIEKMKNDYKAVKAAVSVCQTQPRQKVGRNDPCPCGSGSKFKKCCGINGILQA
ncbi:SEC-C metal-binding domain-containing protein [Magnetovirga frankeli]|uniref:SEC-C metal-binding domain-containing protein n=1 Tax=Magnetovirga frankeli TaxID=947516 RepID=UPI003D348CE9